MLRLAFNTLFVRLPHIYHHYMRLYCLRCNLDFLQIGTGDKVYQLATHSSYKPEYQVYWSDQEVVLFVLFKNINFSKEN